MGGCQRHLSRQGSLSFLFDNDAVQFARKIMVGESITETARLRNEAYRSDCQLNKRRGLYQYATPYYDLEDEIIRRLPLSGTKENRLLDVGCGSGALLLSLAKRFPKIRLTGLDVSPGVFARAAAEVKQQNFPINFLLAMSRIFPLHQNPLTA